MRLGTLSIAFLSLSFQAVADEAEVPRFREVSSGIYRSGRPNKEGLEWLKEDYNLKTIINLENKEFYVEREGEWAEELGIEYNSIPMSASETPKDRDVNEALALLADPSKHPILVHCYHGQDRTGLIIGLHRVEEESWDAETAYEEMKDLGFRTWLYRLDRYYKKRTGMDGKILALLSDNL